MVFSITLIFFLSFTKIWCINLSELTDDQIYRLSKIDLRTLPNSISVKLKHGDNSQWCCANEQPVLTIQRTRIGSHTVVEAFKIVVNYVSCGSSNFLSPTDKCPVYDTIYKTITKYHIEHYDTPNPQSCQNQHVKCCANLLNVAGNCYNPYDIKDHLDILLLLGIVSTAKPPLNG